MANLLPQSTSQELTSQELTSHACASIRARSLYLAASSAYTQAVEHQDALTLQRALIQAEQAYQLQPEDLQIINLLGRICMRQGQLIHARDWIEVGLAIKHTSPSLLYSAGLIELEDRRPAVAEDYFLRSSQLSRVATRAPFYLAHVRLQQGKYAAAFEDYRQLVRIHRDDILLQSRLLEAAAGASVDCYCPELAAEVVDYLQLSGDVSSLSRLATQLLQYRFQDLQQHALLSLNQLIQEPLLLASLHHTTLSHPLLERHLTQIRFSLLQGCIHTLELDTQYLPLVLALISQTGINGGCWAETDDEARQLQQLTRLLEYWLEQAADQQDSMLPALLMLLMYRPLTATGLLAKLFAIPDDWPEPLRHYLITQIDNEQRQRLHRQIMPTFGTPDQALSCAPTSSQSATRNQTLQADDCLFYPHWRPLEQHPQGNYFSHLKRLFPMALTSLSIPTEHTAELLVAGCGTGREALKLAQKFTPLNITAIDLSREALSYGRAHQTDREVSIDWMQGDLRQISWLGKQFDAIECGGVLQQLPNPLSGLLALAEVLKPGGVIKITLHSRIARQGITRLRQQLDTTAITSVTGLQQLRYALMETALATTAGLSEQQCQQLLQRPDFYSLSGCYELLCHNQEQLFDIGDAISWLANAGLRWVGMQAQPEAEQLARQTYGCPASELTPEQWQLLENQSPALFIGRYQFYAIKPADDL